MPFRSISRLRDVIGSAIYQRLLLLAAGWAIVNAIYVYVVMAGDYAYRVESAVLLLVALLIPVWLLGKPLMGGRFVISRKQEIGLIALAIVLWLVACVPLLGFPFLSDDYGFLDLYGDRAEILRAPQFFRPAFAALFFVLTKLGRGSPTAFHATGFLLHAAAAGLVYSLVRRSMDGSRAAVLAFIVFLLNPLQLEASLWVSGLQELLWTVFMLAALRCYVGSRTLSRGRLIVATALVVCALLSKETAVCFVLLLPSADWAFFRFRRERNLAGVYATFGLLLVSYLLLRSRVAKIDAGFVVEPSRYFIKQFLTTPYRFFVMPWNEAAVEMTRLVPAVLVVGCIVLMVAAARREGSPRLLWGPAVIVMSTAPLFGFFYVRSDLLAARYLYFAAAGWALLVAQLAGAVIQKRLVFVMAAASAAVVLFSCLQINLQPWRVAGELVEDMTAALRAGDPVDGTVRAWQARTESEIELKDGVPSQYRGVGIFINSYPEFERRVRSQVPAHARP